VALREGGRGLPGGLSLARLLEEHRNFRNRSRLPRLSIRVILRWADQHKRRTGRWPTYESGLIPETAWRELAHRESCSVFAEHARLTEGSSLADVLACHRGVPNKRRLPSLTVMQIVRWAKQHQAQHGRMANGQVRSDFPDA